MASSCAGLGSGNPGLLNGTALVDGAADAWATGAAETVDSRDAPAMAKEIREYIMVLSRKNDEIVIVSLRKSRRKGNRKKMYESVEERRFNGKMKTNNKGESDSLYIELTIQAEVSIVGIPSRFGETILMEAWKRWHAQGCCGHSLPGK